MGTLRILLSFFTALYCFATCGAISGGMLFPRESESRQIQELDGMWHFRADMSPSRREGFDKHWYLQPLLETGPVFPMPVPSSYNDITTSKELRDFVGWVWYERQFFVSPDWANKRTVLRFDSAHYETIVWVNGKLVLFHVGGHLPFAAVINEFVYHDRPNLLVVAVNNTLTPYTLPPGTVSHVGPKEGYPEGTILQHVQFDFFNYAGIHRRVRIYSTPLTFIDDITLQTTISGTTGIVSYDVVTGGTGTATVSVEVVDSHGVTVASGTGASGSIQVHDAIFWWPYTMNLKEPAYLYRLRVTAMDSLGSRDIYWLPFGIRTVEVTATQLLINGKPFYCHGVAKHEDSDIRGKGLDFPLIARDFHMLKWMGCNCFRTSHYPYAEEILDEADRQGIVIIDECPGVGINTDENFSNRSLGHHLEVMEELVRRDKNRPSVIIWSVANEPTTSNKLADYYFKTVILHTQMLDRTRPVTFVDSTDVGSDLAVKYTDIICVNRYFGWYSDTGHVEVIKYKMAADLQAWNKKFNKPVMVTEYGADTVAGLHSEPSFIFTEDYQVEFMSEYHHVFDEMRKTFLVGEMVWNFADFMTDQGITRVVGNRKGVLTRQRQPKAAAHLLRARYWSIINETRSLCDFPRF